MKNLLIIPMKSRKGAKKEPKRSRKKVGNIRDFEKESGNHPNSAYGRNKFSKKTGTKGYEGTAEGRCTCKRRH